MRTAHAVELLTLPAAADESTSPATATDASGGMTGGGAQAAAARLAGLPGVRFVEPDYAVKPVQNTAAAPNDPDVWQLWGMRSGGASPFGSRADVAWASGGFVGGHSVALHRPFLHLHACCFSDQF